jgi:hypothetical protein
MSFHTFSNLAVQDIIDESAAMNSGGVGFQGFDTATGSGAGPIQTFSDNAPVGILANFSFTGALSPVNNIIEAFKVTGAQAGRTYRVSFFDTTSFGTFLGSFSFTNATNGVLKPLATALRNRAGSVRVERTA